MAHLRLHNLNISTHTRKLEQYRVAYCMILREEGRQKVSWACDLKISIITAIWYFQKCEVEKGTGESTLKNIIGKRFSLNCCIA